MDMSQEQLRAAREHFDRQQQLRKERINFIAGGIFAVVATVVTMLVAR